MGTCACRRARSRIPAPRRTAGSTRTRNRSPRTRPPTRFGSNPTRGTPGKSVAPRRRRRRRRRRRSTGPRRTPRRYRAARARARRADPSSTSTATSATRTFHGRSAVNRSARNAQTFGSVSESVSEKLFNSFSRRLFWDPVVFSGIPSSPRRNRRVASSRPSSSVVEARPFHFLRRARGRTPSPRPPPGRTPPPASATPPRRRRRRRLRRPPDRVFSESAEIGAKRRVRRASDCVVFITRSAPSPLTNPGSFTTKTVGPRGRRVFFGETFSASSRCRDRAHAASRSRLAARNDRPARGWGPRRRRRAARVAAATNSEKTRGRADRGEGSSKTRKAEHTWRAERGFAQSRGLSTRPWAIGGVPATPRACFYPPRTALTENVPALGLHAKRYDPSWTRPPPRWSPGGQKARHAIAPDLMRAHSPSRRPRGTRSFGGSFAKFCRRAFRPDRCRALQTLALEQRTRAAVAGWRRASRGIASASSIARRLRDPRVARRCLVHVRRAAHSFDPSRA